MIEVLACVSFAMGIYSVWMSLANRTEAQRLSDRLRVSVNGTNGRADKLDYMVVRSIERDKATRDEIQKIYGDVKNIGALSRRLDGDMQKVRGDFALVSQYIKELELKTDKTNAELRCFVSALKEGAKVTQKWFPDDNP